MIMQKRLMLAVSGIFVLLSAGAHLARADVSSPITVPLHFTEVSGGGYKLGIYVGIGSNATPALFEFDTGGPGFYAAYSNLPGVSPWWGDDVNSEPSQLAGTTYDSGLQYSGNLATAAVSLFASASPSSALVTTPGNVVIGQMGSIVQTNPSGQIEYSLWTNSGNATPYPPIDRAFYGDFGLSSMYASNGITNLLAQIEYTNGVTAGFRVHVDAASGQAWLQIGLTAADTNSASAKYFDMNVDANAAGALTPNAQLDYFSQQIFNADIDIRDPATGEVLKSTSVGMTPDTGATTSIHNTQLSPEPDKYNDLIEWANQEENVGQLENGLNFGLSGTTTSGEDVSFFDFQTEAGKAVTVQNNHPNNTTYYLNTGLVFFEQYDVIYDWEGKVIGIEAVPEPSSIGLTVLALGLTVGFVLYRRGAGQNLPRA